MISDIKDIRSHLDQLKGKKNQIETSIQSTSRALEKLHESRAEHEQARVIIQEVGQKTQEALAFHISDITSLALESIFDDAYEMVVEFVERRNKNECDLFFRRRGTLLDPTEASGGGAVDVASFALRVASWSMETPRTRPVIILDEPMRFLSTNLQAKASLVLKEISQRLGVQFIIITHEEQLTQNADKTFLVSNRKGISTIKNE